MVVIVRRRVVRAEARVVVYCFAAVALMLGWVRRMMFPLPVRQVRQNLTSVAVRALSAVVMMS